MLGRLARNPFDSTEHIFELKWDGMRALAFIEGGELKLLSRNARNITSHFPELGPMPQLVNSDSVVLDGEIVCLDEENRPSFSRLQQRLQSKRVSRPRINPAHFIAFDVLYVKGRSVMKEPLIQRKKRLSEVLQPTELIQACEYVEAEGTAFFQATCELGLEGIMAKDKSSTYLPGKRTPHWLKVKRVRESEFVVGGYSFGGNRKELFSSLLLGLYDDQQNLVYVGSVGTGFSQPEAKLIYSVLQQFHISDCPFSTIPDVKRLIHWCEPALVCQVEYGEFTVDGKLRYPIYLRHREDKVAIECILSDAPGWPRGDSITVA
jgi:DNA ligase D-like protein (predicted ligase)